MIVGGVVILDTLEHQALVEQVNLFFLVFAAVLVVLMQVGFAALESGLTRAKHTINVALKNILDFTGANIIYFCFGFALMFGTSIDGWFGSSGFFLQGYDEPGQLAFFLFQSTFAGTVATIVSGAVAERIRFLAYLVIAVIVAGFIYPVSGHWVWAEGGWLAERGFIDFAGSTVVHSVGAWVGLAGALLLGPRIGRFNPEDGRVVRMQGHNQVQAVIGVLILWFGWFGFNGGSLLELNDQLPKILVNTTMSAAAGGFTCLVISLIVSHGEVYIGRIIDGVIGGLVAITACCHLVSPGSALLIGFLVGLLMYASEWLIVHKLRIDDPINVVATHGVAGIFGTLCVAWFGDTSALVEQSRWQQTLVQLQGIVAVGLWAFGTGYLFFLLLKVCEWLRVPPDAERLGLNLYEHGTSTGLMELADKMQEILPKEHGGQGNMSKRLEADVGTEAGDIAILFNRIVDSYASTLSTFKVKIDRLNEHANQFQSAADSIVSASNNQVEHAGSIGLCSDELKSMSVQLTDRMSDALQRVKNAESETLEQLHAMQQTQQRMTKMLDTAAEAVDQVSHLSEDAKTISSLLDTIKDIAEQTNMLALNAAIEAARAGESGRGFAVVADEVRTLASKVSESADHIHSTLSGFESRVDSTVTVINRSQEETKDISAQTETLLGSLQQLTGVLQHIDETLVYANTSAQAQQKMSDDMAEQASNVLDSVKTNHQDAQSNQFSSLRLRKIAGELKGQIMHFKLDDDQHSDVA